MTKRALLAVLVLAALLNLLGIDWGLPWNISMHIDDISPWKPLALPFTWLHAFHKYPYFHWLLSLVLYLPYLGWLAATGGLDVSCLPTILPAKGCFTDYYGAPTVLMVISRVLSAAMGVGIVALVYYLARRLHGDRAAALAAAAIAAVCHGLVVYAHLGNLDVPVTFWFLVSLVFAARLAEGGGRRDAVLFALTSAFAVATKEGILGGYVLVGPALWLVMAKHRGRFFHADGFLIIAVLVGVYALIQNPLFNWWGFTQHWVEWLPGGPFLGKERADSPGLMHVLSRIWVDLGSSMGLPLLLVSLAGVVWGSVRHPRLRWLLVPTLSYFVFSTVYPSFIAVRILIPLVVLLTVFAGTFVADGVRHPWARWVAVPVFAFAWGWGFLFALQGDLLMHRDGRRVAEAWLEKHVPRDASVASCSTPVDLPRLDVLGYRPIFVPAKEDCLSALARIAPDFVVVSSASARGMLLPGVPGWHTVWQGTGTTFLSPRFDTPLEWLNPTIRVLAPSPRQEGESP